MKIKKIPLHVQILAALVLGAAFGTFFNVDSKKLNFIIIINGNEKSQVVDNWDSIVVSGTVDDVFELSFLAVLLILVGKGQTGQLFLLPIEIIAFLIAVYLALKVIPKVTNFFEASEDKYFTLAIIIGLGAVLEFLTLRS